MLVVHRETSQRTLSEGERREDGALTAPHVGLVSWRLEGVDMWVSTFRQGDRCLQFFLSSSVYVGFCKSGSRPLSEWYFCLEDGLHYVNSVVNVSHDRC